MRTCLLTAVLLAGGLLAACSPPSAGTDQDAPLTQALRRRDATRVRTQPVEQREMVRTLTTTTVVESEREIELFPRAAGVVVELLAEEGDVVARGDVLARLDDREAQAALDSAELELRQAREDVPGLALAVEEAQARADRARLAYEQAVRDVERNEKAGLISKNELDQLRLTRDTNEADWVAAKLALKSAQRQEETAQTAIDRADLAVAQARLTLSYTELTAPFDGVVASRSIKVGDAVSLSEPAFVLTDPQNLRAVFFRPQRELPLFRRTGDADGNPLEIRVEAEALPGREFHGDIQLVSPTIDPASGSFRITVQLGEPDDEQASLLPGMLVRLSIVTDRHPDALVVPKRALRREGDSSFVFTVEEGLARRHEVREGFATDEDVEILPVETGAVSVGSRVVVAGNRDLEDGAEVLVDGEQEPATGRPASDETVAAGATESTGGGE